MPGQHLVSIQFWYCSATFLFVVSLAALALRKFQIKVDRLDWGVFIFVFASALMLRVYFSPLAVIHGNAHGYEYIRSAFSGEGYFYHGAAYYSFYYWTTSFLGRTPETIFLVNTVLNSVSAILLAVVFRQFIPSRISSYFVAIAYSAWPAAIRIAGSESMFPLAIFLGLLSWICWNSGLRKRRTYLLILSTSILAIAVQTRPSMVCWSAILFTATISECRSLDRAQLKGIILSIGVFTLLAAPWLLFRAVVFLDEALPSHMNFGPQSVLSLGNDTVLALNTEWTPAYVWPLAVIGAFFLLARSRSFFATVTVGLAFFLWFGFSSGIELPEAQIRLQSTHHLFVLLLVGGGYRSIEHRLAGWPHLVFFFSMCIAAASFSASRFALAGHEYNAQTEYRFLEQHTPDLPLDCAVVMPDRFMANRVVSTEFPVWWLRGQHLIEANNLSSVSSPSCLTYYRGISCYRFTWQELQGAPAPSMRPECVDFERGFSLEPLKSQTFKSEPSYECFTTPVSELEIGFFNLVPADHSLEGWRL